MALLFSDNGAALLSRDGAARDFVADAFGSVLNLVFQNQNKQQLATVAPIDGRIDGPNVEVLPTLGNIVRNALVQSFTPTFEKDAKKGGKS